MNNLFPKIIEIPGETKNEVESRLNLDIFEYQLNKLKKDPYLKDIFKKVDFKGFAKVKDDETFKYNPIKFQIEGTFQDFGTGRFVYLLIKLIYIIFRYLFKKDFNLNAEQNQLLIDEPENFLHPSLIRRVSYMLRKINERMNVTIATHSSEVLYYFAQNETEIRFPTTEQEKTPKEQLNWAGGDEEAQEKKKVKRFRLSDLRKKSGKSLNILEKKLFFEALMASKIILVENKFNNDGKLVEYILFRTDDWFENENLTPDVFVFGIDGGKATIPVMYELLKESGRFSPKNDFFVLYDKDEDPTSNNKIEKLDCAKHGFEKNLETTIGHKGKKSEFDPSDYEKTVKDFSKNSRMIDFLRFEKQSE